MSFAAANTSFIFSRTFQAENFQSILLTESSNLQNFAAEMKVNSNLKLSTLWVDQKQIQKNDECFIKDRKF
jgi:hypothetical protein